MKLKQQQAVTIYELDKPIGNFDRKAFIEKRWVNGTADYPGQYLDERVSTTTISVSARLKAIYLDREGLMIVRMWVNASHEWLDWPEGEVSQLASVACNKLIKTTSYSHAVECAVLKGHEWEHIVDRYMPETDSRTDEQVKADAIAHAEALAAEEVIPS